MRKNNIINNILKKILLHNQQQYFCAKQFLHTLEIYILFFKDNKYLSQLDYY